VKWTGTHTQSSSASKQQPQCCSCSYNWWHEAWCWPAWLRQMIVNKSTHLTNKHTVAIDSISQPKCRCGCTCTEEHRTKCLVAIS
jgi:hypothetical protein